MSTLSTADKESSHDDSKYDRPITLDGDPVIWDRNPATLRGALKEVELYYTREGLFQELLSDRAVLIGTKTVVESTFAIPFVKNVISSSVTPYDFTSPCPDSASLKLGDACSGSSSLG